MDKQLQSRFQFVDAIVVILQLVNNQNLSKIP